jgi:nitrate/nitrite transporter NarK
MYHAFFAGLFSLGTALAYVLIPVALKPGMAVDLGPGILCLALLVLWFLFSFENAPLPQRNPVPLVRIIGIRAGWVIGLFHALSWGTAINLGNWIPSLLAESWPNSTASQLAWGAILVMLISGLGRIAGGFVLLRLSPLLVANGSIVVLSLASWGIFVLPSQTSYPPGSVGRSHLPYQFRALHLAHCNGHRFAGHLLIRQLSQRGGNLLHHAWFLQGCQEH